MKPKRNNTKSKYVTVYNEGTYKLNLKVPLIELQGPTVTDKILNGYGMNLVDMTDKSLYNFISEYMITRRQRWMNQSTDNLKMIRRIEEIKV